MRRLRLALLSALALGLGLGVVVLGGGALLLRTDRGNEWVRARVARETQALLGDRGAVHVGRLTLAPLGSFTLDTFAVRDADSVLVLASGPIRARYDVLALLDRHLHLLAVEVVRPVAALASDTAGVWNLAQLLDDRTPRAPRGTAATAWRLTLDSLDLAGGRVTLAPAGADPATFDGLALALGPTRAELGAGTGLATVRRLAVAASAPPLAITDAHGEVRFWRDSLALAFPVLRVPHSTARLDGSIRWGPDAAGARVAGGTTRPTPRGASAAPAPRRVDLTLRSGALDLRDLTWISPLLPAEGRGRAVVRITDGAPGGAMRYALDSLVVDAHDSRLSGRLVAEVGEAVAIRDLDLAADPLDFALIRAVLGDSVPAPPWDGAVHGRLRAPGGPLDRWVIAPSTLEFRDRRIGGARSRLTIAGTLDLLAATTVFRPLAVTLDSLDVRTVGAVATVADSLRGFLTGRVLLEGPLDDYRFRDLDVTHHDGALPVSRVAGAGRLALDTATTWLEATLGLEQVGIASFGRAFTAEPLRGTLRGTLTARARGDSVSLDLALRDGDTRIAFHGASSLDTTRLVLRGDAEVERLDLDRYLTRSKLPAHRLTARARLGLDGTWEAPAGPILIELDSTSELAGLRLRDARADLGLEPGGLRVDTLVLDGPAGRFTARGRLSRDPALRDTLRYALVVDSVALLRGFLSDSLAAAWEDSLAGRVRVTGLAFGSLDTLDLRSEWEVHGLRLGSHAADTLHGELLLLEVPRATRGLATFDAVGLSLAGMPVHRLSAEATVFEPTRSDASIRLIAGDSLYASARADIHWTADSLRIRLDSLDASSREMRWRLERPAMVVASGPFLDLDSLRLRAADGARLEVTARLDTAGPVSARIRASGVPLAHAAFAGLAPAGVEGRISLDADLEGTADAPLLRASGRLDGVHVEGRPAPALALDATYALRRLDLTLRGRSVDTSATRDAFLLRAELPFDLALAAIPFERRKVPEEAFIRLTADGTSLTGFEALLPGISELRGGVDADVLISGQWGALEPRGVILVRDGAFAVPALRTGFRDLLMDVALTPDSVILHRVRLADERSPGDSAALDGVFFRRDGRWHADVRSMARSLRVIDDPRVASADVSWQLALRGRTDSLLLGGVITVPTASAYIGRQRAVLDVEDAPESGVALGPYMPRIDALTVRLGSEVRLRSAEANVQLTGDIAVSGALGAPIVRGDIVATRGTYRLDLGPLQRTFHVDSGLVRMNGPLDLPATLDIHASYLVRQAERDDVRIRARLTGTVREPRLALSSADLGTAASDTEIISYLLFGSPSFALDTDGTWAVRTATAALVPSLGGAVERALGSRLPFLSELQVTTVAGDSPTDFTLNSFEGILNSLALAAGAQIGPDTYLNLSGGVCRGENRAAQSPARWFGIGVEYRPRERLSALLSLTPGSAPCNRVGTFGQIYQFGLDLYRDWRW